MDSAASPCSSISFGLACSVIQCVYRLDDFDFLETFTALFIPREFLVLKTAVSEGDAITPALFV